MTAAREMPKYQCHKRVWALKIARLELDFAVAMAEGRETDGGAWLTPAEEGYAKFKVSAEYVEKHKPHEGGYYVVYSDGYKSFSPAAAFEYGYSRICAAANRTGAGMKRFIVFAYDHNYPGGGWNDFKGLFDEWAGADQDARWQVARSGGSKDYAQVVDTVTGKTWQYE